MSLARSRARMGKVVLHRGQYSTLQGARDQLVTTFLISCNDALVHGSQAEGGSIPQKSWTYNTPEELGWIVEGLI